MAYLLAAAIIIPIILTIWTYNPLWELEEQAKEESIDIGHSQDEQLSIIFFGFLVIWLLILGRILYLMKKGVYDLRRKF